MSFRPSFITHLAAAVCLLLAGCGGDGVLSADAPVPEGTTTGPHGGISVPLPGGAGFAELKLDRSGVKPGKAGGARIAVFFLGPDGKSALSPAPTDVTIKVTPPGSGGPVSLTASPDAAAKGADAGRLLSSPGDLDYDELRGELTATVGGSPVTQKFAIR